jgi:hypothetical protein
MTDFLELRSGDYLILRGTDRLILREAAPAAGTPLRMSLLGAGISWFGLMVGAAKLLASTTV